MGRILSALFAIGLSAGPALSQGVLQSPNLFLATPLSGAGNIGLRILGAADLANVGALSKVAITPPAPPPSTPNQALLINVAAPASGSTTAPTPVWLNEIEAVNRYTVFGVGGTSPGSKPFGQEAAFTVRQLAGGASQKGISLGEWVVQYHDQASSSNNDHIALASLEYTDVADTSGGDEFGSTTEVHAASGANVLEIVGEENDTVIDAGATVPARWGLRIVNDGGQPPSGIDNTAIGIVSTNSGGPFSFALMISHAFGQNPMATGVGAAIIGEDYTGWTIDQIIDFHNITINHDVFNFSGSTINGNLINSANFVIDGGGHVKESSMQLTASQTIASLGACGAGTLGLKVLVNNGLAGPQSFVHVSTTGADTRFVSCVNDGGFSWVYE